MANAFLSHSHHDRKVAQRLHAALVEAKKDVWADWEDIPPASRFQRDLDEGVAGSEALVFLISPDSVSSDYCLAELERATEMSKRIVPVVHRPVDDEAMPQALSEHQWIPAEGCVEDDFRHCVETVIKAIDTDPEWTREHTYWGNEARAWDADGRDDSMLLRGEELERGEGWLARAPGHAPAPSALVREYVQASREAATRGRRIRMGAGGVALALLVGLGVIALLVVSNQNEKDRKVDYVRGVGAILSESRKGLGETQKAFNQLEAIAKDERTVTPAAEIARTLKGALRQRRALGRKAERLGTPSELARRTRQDLMTVFALKADNIEAIQRCLLLVGGSSPATGLHGCLDGTKTSSDAAGTGRQRFFDDYNRLEKDAGLEATREPF